MKSIFTLFLGILALSAAATFSHADIEGAPFIPESDRRFDAIEQGNHLKYNCYPQGSCDGHWVRQLAMATYDFSKVGGSSTANPNGIGAGIYDLGVSLPKNAVITESYLYSVTAPTTATGGQLEFFCQSAGDIAFTHSTGTFSAAGGSIDGSSRGAIASNFKYTTAKCDINAKITVGTLTAGKVTAFVQYVVHQ